jgi:hypothetical protein
MVIIHTEGDIKLPCENTHLPDGTTTKRAAECSHALDDPLLRTVYDQDELLYPARDVARSSQQLRVGPIGMIAHDVIAGVVDHET